MTTELPRSWQPRLLAHSSYSDDCCQVRQRRAASGGLNSLSILRHDVCGNVKPVPYLFTGQGFSRFIWNGGRGIRTQVARGSSRDPFCSILCLLHLPTSHQVPHVHRRLARRHLAISSLFCSGPSHVKEASMSNCELRFHASAVAGQSTTNYRDCPTFQSQEAHCPYICGVPHQSMAIVRSCCKHQHDWEATMNSGHTFGVRPVLGATTRRRRFRANAIEPEGERKWWQKVLFQPIPVEEEDEEQDLGGYSVDDPLDDTLEDEEMNRAEAIDEIDEMLADDAKFSEWQRKNAVREEVREFGRTGRDPDSRDWEDWLDDDDNSGTFGVKDSGWYYPESDWEKNGMPRVAPKKPVRGMKRTVTELFFRMFEPQEEVEEDLKFEEKIFRYTSQESAKFAALLLILPFLVDVSVHDYVLVPFLKRYVDTVPLAAQVLDVRRSQKLMMVRELKLERQRVRFEAELGKAPPLSEEELADHLRHEALELQDEYRAENRAAFASIWSDLLAVFAFFMLLVLNPTKVAILSMTGDRLFTNISDTGKAFIIILLTDIFLGYHSSMGWETVIEMVLERYGFDADQGAIYLFVAIVPVTIDAFFKLWVFRYFTRLSPSAAATFREMSRH